MSSTKVLEYKSTISGMSKKPYRPQPREILSKNLRYLMDREKLSELEMGRRAQVAQKTVNKILNQTSSATLDTIDNIAGALGLKPWELVDPDLIQRLGHPAESVELKQKKK